MIKKRSISQAFYNALKNGVLQPLLNRVIEDDTLCLELRGSFVNIYYRGGSLFRVSYDNDTPSIFFDTNYNHGDNHLESSPTVAEAVELLPFYKQAMDRWFHHHPKYEREFQQTILRENNSSGNISRATDYFIVDIEYADASAGARFDMVAFKWLSNGASRKQTDNLSLALIEVKYGDNALSGSAGILKHLDDFKAFLNVPEKLREFKEDMVHVFRQKCSLGLIDGLKESQFDVSLSDVAVPETIFIFANHDPDSKKLNSILSEIDTTEYVFPILIAQSSAMGYGLYTDNIVPIQNFLN